jgi:hypothetical protein
MCIKGTAQVMVHGKSPGYRETPTSAANSEIQLGEKLLYDRA